MPVSGCLGVLVGVRDWYEGVPDWLQMMQSDVGLVQPLDKVFKKILVSPRDFPKNLSADSAT